MVLDRNLNQISDEKLEQRYKDLFAHTAVYLKQLSSMENEKTIQSRLPHTKAVLLSNSDRSFYRNINGQLCEFKSSENAWTTSGKITIENGTTFMDSYTYVREKATDHQIRHEAIHAFTSQTEAEKIDNETYAFKIGVDRSFYKTSNGNLLEGQGFYEDGAFLNEGLTDYLTYLSENKGISESPYLQNVLLAAFLTGSSINPSNNLLQAFVSDSVSDIDRFAQDFDSYSNGNVKYKDIAEFKGNSTTQRYGELLTESMGYRVKSSKSPEDAKSQIMFYTNTIGEMQHSVQLKDRLSLMFEGEEELLLEQLQTQLHNLQTAFVESQIQEDEIGLNPEMEEISVSMSMKK